MDEDSNDGRPKLYLIGESAAGRAPRGAIDIDRAMHFTRMLTLRRAIATNAALLGFAASLGAVGFCGYPSAVVFFGMLAAGAWVVSSVARL